MSSLRIEEVPELTAHVTALKALGYRSKEEVLGVARAAGPALSSYLGTDAASLLTALEPQGGAPAAVTVHRRHPLGVQLDSIPAPKFAFSLPMAAVAPVALPPSVDLFVDMPPPLDQGDRSTCVAFAALAVVENRDTHANAYQQMSEQFLYWLCKQNDSIPTLPGTYLAVAFPQLQSYGCCLDATWNYVAQVVVGNESQGPPPATAAADAATHRISAFNQLSPTSVADIKRELANGHCVAFSIPVFNSWYLNPVVESTGDIMNPLPGETVVGGHAMAIFGYQDTAVPEADPGLGGGHFLIRNSWSNWGGASAHGAGYGTIPYSYLARLGKEAYSLT
jgi:Papain family cysteine protease